MFIKKILAGVAGGVLLSLAFGGVAQAANPSVIDWTIKPQVIDWTVKPPSVIDWTLKTTPACANLDGWTTPEDENAPTPSEDGLLFGDGANLHHSTSLDLADVRPGSFKGEVKKGSAPLFKVWTTGPYTTFNQVTVDGQIKWWASLMTPDQEGGQNHPLASLADFVGLDVKPGKTKIQDETKVVEFGLGYGNDAGNEFLATSVKFHGHTYDLTCKKASPSPSATTTKPTKKPTAKPTATRSSSAAAPVQNNAGSDGGTTAQGGASLPVTGVNGGLLIGGAAVLLVGGVVALVLGRKRRAATFTA